METTRNNFSGSDANYNNFQSKLLAYLFDAKQLAFTPTADEKTEGARLQKVWIEGYALVVNPSTKTTVSVKNKDDARKEYTKFLRNMVNKYIFGNDNITDSTRVDLGLTVKDTTPTPVEPPKDIPFFAIDFSKKGVHQGSLWTNTFVGEKKRKQKRPKGVALAVIRWDVADKPPVNYEDLKHLLLTSDSHFTLQFTQDMKGKTVYYAACWSNSKGEMGAWTEIINAIIN
ncbi:MAG: hypothetical protein LBL74_00370 [Bacteroidales bacterium]|jgi:hypothetical protein|nr:hypothetical protein [Bacteroidales bacterium]